MSTNKKLDEASVASMINGFLSNQKVDSNQKQKKNLERRHEAFWKVVKESLNEAAPRRGSEDPDDWRQSFDAPMNQVSVQDIPGEDGGFSSSDEQEPETVRTPRHKDEEKADTKRSHGRKISSGELTKLVNSTLAKMKSRNPEKFAQEFENLSDSEKMNYRIRLANKIKEQGALSVEKGAGDTLKGGKFAESKRKTATSQLAFKVLSAATEEGGITPELIAFAKRFLDVDLKSGTVLSKFAELGPEERKSVADSVAAKALVTPASAQNLVKFMNSKLDMYPHEWMDKAEEFANKKGLPGVGEDRAKGIGAGVKKLGDEGGSSSVARKNPTMASKKRAEEWKNQVTKAGREDLTGKVVGRKHVGDTSIDRILQDYPLEDILRYGDYFTQNPEEIQRAKEERRNPPPSSLDDMMGKVPGIGKEKDFNVAEIGGEDESNSIFTPSDLRAAKKQYASSQAKFNAGKENIKKAEEAGAKKYIHPAANQFDADIGINTKEMFKNLTNVGTFDKPVKKIPGLTKRLIADISNRINLKSKDFGGERTSPDEILDILKKLAEFNPKGEYKGMSGDIEGRLAPEEHRVAKELLRIFDPKRVSREKDRPKDDEFNLPSEFQKYASSELEKLVANIPAREKAIEDEKSRQDREVGDLERKRQRDIDSAMSPEQMKAQDEDRIKRRAALSGGIKDRLAGLDKEREQERAALNQKLGDSDEYDQIKKASDFFDMDSVKNPQDYRKPEAKPVQISPDELKAKTSKAIERLKASSPEKYAKYAKMSPEEKQKFESSMAEKVKSALQKKAQEKTEQGTAYNYLANQKKLQAMKDKERDPVMLKRKQMKLSRLLDKGKSLNPDSDKAELEKVQNVLPHAVRSKELGDIYKPSAYVPPELGPTKAPTQRGIPAKSEKKVSPERKLQKHGGSVTGTGSDISFKYDTEDQTQMDKRVISKLIGDAKQKIVAAGAVPSAKTIAQYVAGMVDLGRYPKQYAKYADMISKFNSSPDIASSMGSSLKMEGKNMKKKMSLMELLITCDDSEPKHIDHDENPWEKAKPEKQMKFEPKFQKQKKVGK